MGNDISFFFSEIDDFTTDIGVLSYSCYCLHCYVSRCVKYNVIGL